MQIIVCVKQVPVRDSALRVDPSGQWLEEDDLSWEMNEPDAYALEEALQLKESQGGEVIVVSAGPARVQSTIREALAKGADRGIHIEVAEDQHPDAFVAARWLADALRDEKPDLILTGLQSDDLGFGQTGVILAELLGFAHATIIMDMQPQGAGLRVKRELEDGWFQYVTLPLPAVLTVQSGIRRLRYATLMGIKKAKTKQLKTIPATAVQAASSTGHLYAPPRNKGNQILTGPPQAVAQQLVEKLRFEARVL